MLFFGLSLPALRTQRGGSSARVAGSLRPDDFATRAAHNIVAIET
jgi:hypothetical protein